MAESLEPCYGYRGEIRPGKPGTTKFDRDGNVIHFVDEETWKNMREILGIVEERIEENSYHETIGKFKTFHHILDLNTIIRVILLNKRRN